MIRCNSRGLLSGKECTSNDDDALQWEGEQGGRGGEGRAGEEVTAEQRS